jgi:cytoskeleton protein RodZ
MYTIFTTFNRFNLSGSICYGSSMSSELKKLREDLNRDLKEIAAATRIKESFLRAIENEQYDKLPIEVYARGYIKVYAKCVGLDFDAALQPYEKYLEAKAGPKEKKPEPVQNEIAETAHSAGEKIENKSAEPVHKVKEENVPLFAQVDERPVNQPWYFTPRYIWKGVLLVVVICAVIIVQLVASNNSRKEAAKNTLPPTAAIKKAEPQKQDQHEIAVSPKVETTATQLASPAKPQPANISKPQADQPKRRHVLVLTATEKSWIQVVLDGKDKKEAMMVPGETLTYEAYRNITGIIGNGGGVKIKFNGKQLPAGKKGEVLYLNFPENNTPGAQPPAADRMSANPNRSSQPSSSRQL